MPSDNNYNIKFQDGTVPENGVNGLQVEEALEQVLARIQEYQAKVPCRENAIVITKLEESIMWLNKRTADRKARGVEGTEAK
jgi:hypothetical protein